MRLSGTASVNWIADAEALAAGVARWRSAGPVAMDTEFIRTRTFYPIPALYQIATRDELTLIDPLAIEDWRAFIEWLGDVSVTKVMHACSEDLDVFLRHFDLLPAGLVDTQVAAAFVTGEFSPGYANLVARFTGITLEKHETRSDWLVRPLTERQVRYAAEDVGYLLAIYDRLSEALRASGRWEWFVEENARRLAPQSAAPADYYRQLGAGWRLDRRGVARLKALCTWRELRARERDVPRRRVLEDDVLMRLAAAGPDRREEILGERPGGIRRQAATLISLLEQADELPEGELPEKLEPPLDEQEARAVKLLRDHGRDVARTLGIAEELLVRRRDLERYVRAHRARGALNVSAATEQLSGWRAHLVADAYRDILARHLEPRRA